MSRQGIDLFFQRADARRQALSVCAQRRPVHQKAFLLHLGQNAAQRHLDLLKQGRHALLPERLCQHRGQGGNLGRLVGVFSRLPAHAERRNAVVRIRRPQQIPGKGCVEHKAVPGQPRCRCPVHQVLYAMGTFFHGIREDRPQGGIKGFRLKKHLRQAVNRAVPRHRAELQRRQVSVRQRNRRPVCLLQSAENVFQRLRIFHAAHFRKAFLPLLR